MDFSFMSRSLGKHVRLERGGPDQITGKLVAIMPDCLAIATQREGVVYVHTNHVKTISESIKAQVSREEGYPYEEIEVKAPVVEAENWTDLLTKLEHRLVRINHFGPDSLQGLLMNIRPESATVLHDMKEYIHYSNYHMRSIIWVMNNDVRAAKEQKR